MSSYFIPRDASQHSEYVSYIYIICMYVLYIVYHMISYIYIVVIIIYFRYVYYKYIPFYLLISMESVIFAPYISEQPRQMAKIIAIINDKGGVSKTTTTMNLGTALWLLGYKVLLVDSDKQCNLTITMDKSSYAPGVTTLYDWLLDENMAPPVYERYPGLDYVPSSVRIDELNTWLADQVARETFLGARLNLVRSEYDFILVDCAPGCTTVINKNAIAASDGVIIPVRADLYSVQGKDAVINIIEQINRGFNKRIEMMGYLLTQFERTRMGNEVRDFFQGGSAPVFPVPIRKCAKCNEAPKDQMSLYEFAADSTAADDYMRLAEYLTNRLPRRKNWLPKEWGRKAASAHDVFLRSQEG